MLEDAEPELELEELDDEVVSPEDDELFFPLEPLEAPASSSPAGSLPFSDEPHAATRAARLTNETDATSNERRMDAPSRSHERGNARVCLIEPRGAIAFRACVRTRTVEFASRSGAAGNFRPRPRRAALDVRRVMKDRLSALGGLTVLAALAACYTGPHVDPDRLPAPTTEVAPTDPEEEPAPEEESTPAPSAPTCTSKKTWTNGDRGSKLMHPGTACIDCHETSRKRTPLFAFAGTVYSTLHEVDDCYGVASGVSVVVTDKNGKKATAAVNAAGNFYFEGTLVPPLSAKVVAGSKESVMKDPVDTGDCNSCHTKTGKNDAKGRITTP